jgi:hypothetical protein
VSHALQESSWLAPERAFVLDQQHGMALFLLTSSQQVFSEDCLLDAFVVYVPTFSMCSCAESFWYSAQVLWEVQTCKHFCMYSVASLVLGSGRVLLLTDSGTWDISSRALIFHVCSGL